MMQNDESAAKAIIADINGWDIQSISFDPRARDSWKVVIGSAPRIVGDLLPEYDEGSDDGVVLPLEPRDGTVEYDETVMLRRSPNPGAQTPGIVMWGHLTCAYGSRDAATFFGTIAFYEEEEEGQALMVLAQIDHSRLVVARALDEVDVAIGMLDGHGAHVARHADRILAQMGRLNAILQKGIEQRDSTE